MTTPLLPNADLRYTAHQTANCHNPPIHILQEKEKMLTILSRPKLNTLRTGDADLRF